MATISSVTVALGVETAGVRRGLDRFERQTRNTTRRARQDFERFNRSLDETRNLLLGLGAAFGAAQIGRNALEIEAFAAAAGLLSLIHI